MANKKVTKVIKVNMPNVLTELYLSNEAWNLIKGTMNVT